MDPNTYIFEFRCYEKHRTQTMHEESGLFVDAPHQDSGWRKFQFSLCVNRVCIDYFRADVIFDDDNMPIPCTRIYLSDGSFMFAELGYVAFRNIYLSEYLPIVRELNKISQENQDQ